MLRPPDLVSLEEVGEVIALHPMETVAEVKISLTDKRVNVQHRDVLTPDELINLLNAKHLGASLVDRSVEVEGVGSSFTHAETVRLTVNATQLVLFAATVALECVKFRKAAFGLGLATVALSFALFQEAYLAVRRRSPNVELMPLPVAWKASKSSLSERLASSGWFLRTLSQFVLTVAYARP